MTVKEQFEKLKDAWINAATPEERAAADSGIRRLAADSPDEFGRAFYEGAAEAADQARSRNVRAELEPVAKMISFAYIAENHFHKSRGWLSQKMTGATVNGKPARFTKSDIATLADALDDISVKLSAVAKELRNH